MKERHAPDGRPEDRFHRNGRDLEGIPPPLSSPNSQSVGVGDQRLAERELSWNRQTLRKAMHELAHRLQSFDATGTLRRKRAEERLLHLLADIKTLVDNQSQTDPQFRSQRLYAQIAASLLLRAGFGNVATLDDKAGRWQEFALRAG